MVRVAESDFCIATSNFLHEKYKEQIETKFLASFQYMRIAICLKKLFRTENIENIIKCLIEEFERYALLRLKWTPKPKIESGRITLDFPFSVVFVYNKEHLNKNESRYCWQTLS